MNRDDIVLKGDDATITIGTPIGGETSLWITQGSYFGHEFNARIWLTPEMRRHLIETLQADERPPEARPS